jgi:arylformamidase
MSAPLIDISPVISARTAVWPGDERYQRRVSMRLEDGDSVTLGALSTTLHIGAHADAPSHYKRGGVDIASRPLEPYYGDCQVIEVRLPRGARIEPAHVPEPIAAPRVLFRTGSFPDPNDFNEDFNSLSAALIDSLHAAGVVLVGIDTPSVDPFSDAALESHNALARCDMCNLEGLVLAHVEPGSYTLVALPLRIAEADASPVRAALIGPR